MDLQNWTEFNEIGSFRLKIYDTYLAFLSLIGGGGLTFLVKLCKPEENLFWSHSGAPAADGVVVAVKQHFS